MEKFTPFLNFYSEEEAEQQADLLRQHKVPCIVNEVKSTIFDEGIFGGKHLQQWALLIEKTNWEKAQKILHQTAKEELKHAEIDSDHYLLSFNDDELLEVIQKQDEWNAFDVELATLILKERGIELRQKDIQELQEERVEKLKTEQPVGKTWLIVAYLALLAHGLISVVIGLYILTKKTTLPNGDLVPYYDDYSRAHAKAITIVGIVIFFISYAYNMNVLYLLDLI